MSLKVKLSSLTCTRGLSIEQEESTFEELQRSHHTHIPIILHNQNFRPIKPWELIFWKNEKTDLAKMHHQFSRKLTHRSIYVIV